MSKTELQKKVDELRELRRMADDLDAEISAIEGELKSHMDALSTDTLYGDDFTLTYKPVTSNRLDSKALKAAAPELYQRFSKQTTTRRFIVA